MHLGALAEVLLCVCEEVVRTGANEIGTADFRVVEGELSCARGGLVAHKLLKQLSLLGGHVSRRRRGAPVPLDRLSNTLGNTLPILVYLMLGEKVAGLSMAIARILRERGV